jgi:DNA invertase Pin-like site-specific DNA recombinase
MDRTPICYGYGRHSTNKQEMTREVQEHRTYQYWERNLKDKGVVWGGFYYDAATSAKTPFSERQEGRPLFAAALPGDHIVVTKLDRAFRSLRDGISSMEQWKTRGVFFHTMDLQVDTSTPVGKFFYTILLAVAELEREFARERTRDVMESCKRQGKPFSKACPAGWKIVGKRGNRRFRVDEDERATIDSMATLRSNGASLEELALWSQRQTYSKRSFPTRQQVRWALDARRAGYPKVGNYKEFNRKVSAGEIVLR